MIRVMKGRVAKSRQNRRSGLKYPQEKLLDAVVAGTCRRCPRFWEWEARVDSSGKEALPSLNEQSPGGGHLGQENTALQPDERRPHKVSIHSSPSERRVSRRTDTRRPGVTDEEAEQAGKARGSDPVSPATGWRKRQVDGDGDDNNHQLKRARLTTENLTLFDKMGKKKGTNKTSVSAPSDSTIDSPTTKAKSISTTTSGFADQAYKNGILLPIHSKAPKNLDDLYARLARSIP